MLNPSEEDKKAMKQMEDEVISAAGMVALIPLFVFSGCSIIITGIIMLVLNSSMQPYLEAPEPCGIRIVFWNYWFWIGTLSFSVM